MLRAAWRFCVVGVFVSSVIAMPRDAAAQNVTVSSATPSSGAQATTGLAVTIAGKNFAPGARADFLVSGTTDPGGITVRSTSYVSATQLSATIDIADAALLSYFDIKVTNTNGRSGKGSDLFKVTSKSSCIAEPYVLPAAPLVLNTAPANTSCTVGVSGTLDCGFGTNGRTVTALKPINSVLEAAVQPDGKLLVLALAGSTTRNAQIYDAYVLRYTSDGQPDATFGAGGVALSSLSATSDNEHPESLAVQPDGKILVVGWVPQKSANVNKVAVTRLLPDGTLDVTFGSSGRMAFSFGSTTVNSLGTKIALQADGAIVIGGNTGDQLAVARLLPSGAFDVSFGVNGISVLPAGRGPSAGWAIGFQSWGGQQYAIVGGARSTCTNGDKQMAVVRLLPAGGLDTSFGPAGTGETYIDIGGNMDYGYDLAVDATNQVLLGGSSRTSLSLVRLAPDGTLDSSFGNGGATLINVASFPKALGFKMALDAQGRPVVAGVAYSADVTVETFLVVRFLEDGSPDTAFGGGAAITAFGLSLPKDSSHGIAIQPDGRVVLAGRVNDFAGIGVAGYVP